MRYLFFVVNSTTIFSSAKHECNFNICKTHKMKYIVIIWKTKSKMDNLSIKKQVAKYKNKIVTSVVVLIVLCLFVYFFVLLAPFVSLLKLLHDYLGISLNYI